MALRKRSAILTTAAAFIAVGIAAYLVFVFSGWYNVAATEEHWAATRWSLLRMTERSVEAHAEQVGAMPEIGPDELQHGYDHYAAMCETCHGAPGVQRSEIGRGLRPEPPELAEEVPEWTDQQLFWIVKHGFKFTGMPGFGPTHSDQELWGIVAFLRQLPEMTPAEYQAFAARSMGHHHGAAADSAAAHEHAPGDSAAAPHTHTDGTTHQH